MSSCNNNFDCSSSGVNIECSVFLDDFMSRMNFEENFEILVHSSWGVNSVSIYKDYGNLSDEYCIDNDLVIDETKLSRVKMLKHLVSIGEYYSDFKDCETVFEMLGDLIQNDNIKDYIEVLDDAGIEYSRNYITMTTTGYSQGDFAEILVNVNEFEDVHCVNFNKDKHQQYFDNLFWDAPMSVRVTIDGEDFISEKFDGQYRNWIDGKYFDYDKDEFIAEILENFEDVDSDLLKSELDEILPSEVGY